MSNKIMAGLVEWVIAAGLIWVLVKIATDVKMMLGL